LPVYQVRLSTAACVDRAVKLHSLDVTPARRALVPGLRAARRSVGHGRNQAPFVPGRSRHARSRARRAAPRGVPAHRDRGGRAEAAPLAHAGVVRDRARRRRERPRCRRLGRARLRPPHSRGRPYPALARPPLALPLAAGSAGSHRRLAPRAERQRAAPGLARRTARNAPKYAETASGRVPAWGGAPPNSLRRRGAARAALANGLGHAAIVRRSDVVAPVPAGSPAEFHFGWRHSRQELGGWGRARPVIEKTRERAKPPCTMLGSMGSELATLLVSCRDRRGIVAALAQVLFGHGANILDADQHTDPVAQQFFQRIRVDLSELLTD